MTTFSVRKLTFSAILIAIGILIPLIMPIKIIIGPASFTLASHVPIFLAMFLSPGVAVLVALGTALGFFLSFPAIIAFRALSHVLFVAIGALILQKKPQIVGSFRRFQVFNIGIGLIHALAELAVVSIFFFQGNMAETTYTQGYFYTVFLLVGVGGWIHSIIDGSIAYYIGERLSHLFEFPVFVAAKKYVPNRPKAH